MGFNDEGLGAAMAESYLRDRADAQTKLIAALERKVDDLAARLIAAELEVSKCLDAARFQHKYYVYNQEQGKWPLEPKEAGK